MLSANSVHQLSPLNRNRNLKCSNALQNRVSSSCPSKSKQSRTHDLICDTLIDRLDIDEYRLVDHSDQSGCSQSYVDLQRRAASASHLSTHSTHSFINQTLRRVSQLIEQIHDPALWLIRSKQGQRLSALAKLTKETPSSEAAVIEDARAQEQITRQHQFSKVSLGKHEPVWGSVFDLVCHVSPNELALLQCLTIMYVYMVCRCILCLFLAPGQVLLLWNLWNKACSWSIYTLRFEQLALDVSHKARWLDGSEALDLLQEEQVFVLQSVFHKETLRVVRVLQSVFHKETLRVVRSNEQVAKAETIESNPFIQEPGLHELRRLTQVDSNHDSGRLHDHEYRSVFRHVSHTWNAFSTVLYKNQRSLLQLKSKRIQTTKQVASHLQLDDKPVKQYLFVGPTESGKSYLATDLASRRDIPLVYVNVADLMLADIGTEVDVGMGVGALSSQPVSDHRDSTIYRRVCARHSATMPSIIARLMFLLNLAKMVSPCVVWIPDLHKLGPTVLSEVHLDDDPTILLHRISHDLFQHSQRVQAMLLIASSPNVNTLQPVLLSARRFSRLLNVRILDTTQRQRNMFILLRSKRPRTYKHKLWNEIGTRTTGCNWRELVNFINELHLISITRRTHSVDTNTLMLAFHRQDLKTQLNTISSRFTKHESLAQASVLEQYESTLHAGWLLEPKRSMICYKIGQAVVQGVFGNPSVLLPFATYHHFHHHSCKRRFYELCKSYWQPALVKTSVTELTILPYILSCLAGTAAQDVCIVFDKQVAECALTVHSELSHDLELASGLFEALFRQIARPDIYLQVGREPHCLSEFQTISHSSTASHLKGVAHIDAYNRRMFSYRYNGLYYGSFLDNTYSVDFNHRLQAFNIDCSLLFQIKDSADHQLAQTVPLTRHVFLYPHYAHHSELPCQQTNTQPLSIRTGMANQQPGQVALSLISTRLMQYKRLTNSILFMSPGGVLLSQDGSHTPPTLPHHQGVLTNQNAMKGVLALYNEQPDVLSMLTSRRVAVYMGDVFLEDSSLESQAFSNSEAQSFTMFECVVQNSASESRSKLYMLRRLSKHFTIQAVHENLYCSHRQQVIAYVERLTYGTLLESYHYLLRFFLFHNDIYIKIIQALFEQNSLFSEHVQAQMRITP